MTPQYFNETCEPVDTTKCAGTGHYINPCDCSKYYQCDPNRKMMFNHTCNSAIFNGKTSVCDHLSKDVCDPTYPWKRCSASENRMEELRLMCEKKEQDDHLPDTSALDKNNVHLQLMQMLLSILFAAVVLIVIVCIIWNNFRSKQQKKKDASIPPEAEKPRDHSVLDGYQNDIIQETRLKSLYRSGSIMRSTPSGSAGSHMDDRAIQRLNTRDTEVLYDNCVFSNDVGQYGSTACPLTTPPPEPSRAPTEPDDETTRSVITQEEGVVSIYVGQTSTITQPTMGCDPRPPWPYKITKVKKKVKTIHLTRNERAKY